MEQTGTIEKVKFKEQFDTQYGTMYKFDMAIATSSGRIIGTINSKANVYPKGNGDPITVEVTQDQQHGTKFKAVTTGYSGGGGQSNSGGRDFDKENRGKCFCNYVSSKLASGVKGTILLQDGAEISALWKLAEMSIDGPASGGMNESQQGQYDGSSGPRNLNPDWVGDDPEKPADDIPF